MAKMPDEITLFSFTVRSIWFYILLGLTAINTAISIYGVFR